MLRPGWPPHDPHATPLSKQSLEILEFSRSLLSATVLRRAFFLKAIALRSSNDAQTSLQFLHFERRRLDLVLRICRSERRRPSPESGTVPVPTCRIT